jgi:hypothetical protein
MSRWTYGRSGRLAGSRAGFGSEPFRLGRIWPVKFCQHAFAEGGRSVCLEVDSDVTGCHGWPRSSGPAGDRADRGGYLRGVKVERIEQEVVQRLPE